MFIVGLAIALWSASSYVGAFIRASNAIYETEEGRPFYKLRPLQMGVTLVMLMLIALSLAAIVIGALTFIIDFDAAEQGIRYGLPERYAWYCDFGLLVGLIFLYWQILGMLGYLRR